MQRDQLTGETGAQTGEQCIVRGRQALGALDDAAENRLLDRVREERRFIRPGATRPRIDLAEEVGIDGRDGLAVQDADEQLVKVVGASVQKARYLAAQFRR